MDAVASISDHVESLQRRGRYAFTRAEAAAALSLSETALTKGFQRLTRKGRVRMLRRGYGYKQAIADGIKRIVKP